MEYYLLIIAVLIIAASIILLFAKNFHERILVLNQIGSLSILFAAVLSCFGYYKPYIDVVFIYILFSFVSVKALVYYQKQKMK